MFSHDAVTCPRGSGESALDAWLTERLSPIHTPDPALVRRHNAEPRNQDWQLPEEGPVEQADVAHDLLAYLAEQMIALNKEKQGGSRVSRPGWSASAPWPWAT